MRLGDHCGLILSAMARSDLRVWVLDGDLADSDGAVHFAQEHPERFLMAGASEQCMISVAAGMSACGLRPWVFSFAAFLCYRAYDQIRVCVSQARQPVTLVGSHSGGCGGRNGKTHLALNDIALMSSLPGVEVWAPASPADLRFAMEQILRSESPVYLRLPRAPVRDIRGPAGLCEWIAPRCELNIISTGLGTHFALRAVEALHLRGERVGLLHCCRVSPLPDEARRLAQESSRLVVVEDHYTTGGLASLLRECSGGRICALGWPPGWAGKSGSEEELLALHGLDSTGIRRAVLDFETASSATA